jgi:hypothetical protein
VRTTWIGLVVVVGTALSAASGRAEPTFEKTRIPHRDGSGRATIVEIDPAVPGAREFVRGDERPAPARGEVSLPSPTPIPTSSPADRPGRRP